MNQIDGNGRHTRRAAMVIGIALAGLLMAGTFMNI